MKLRVENPFRPPAGEPPALDANRLALVVNDIQYFDAHRDWGEGRTARERGVLGAFDDDFEQLRPATPSVQRLLAIATPEHRPAAWRGEDRGAPDRVRRHGRAHGGRPGPQSSAARARRRSRLGTYDAEWLPEIAPSAGEVVLTKPAAGVCTGTGVEDLLRDAGVRTVVLAGMSHDGGAEGSLRSLTDRGYGAILPPDACATYGDELKTRLWRLETGIINVTSAADIAARLAGRLAAEADRANAGPR